MTELERGSPEFFAYLRQEVAKGRTYADISDELGYLTAHGLSDLCRRHGISHPRAPKRHAPEVFDRIRQLAADGKTVAEIVETMGESFTRNTILGIAHRYKIKLLGASAPRLPHTQEEVDQVRQLIEIEGKTQAEVAEITGLSRSAVAHLVARNKITYRKIKVKPPKPAPTPDPNAGWSDVEKDPVPLRPDAWTVLEGSSPRPVVEHKGDHECRWPVGEAPILFCCQPTFTKRDGKQSRYCREHAQIAHRDLPPRKAVKLVAVDGARVNNFDL